MRVLLHTGKGGVGKTTMALASAFGAASHGHRVFVLSTDAAHSIGDALGAPLGSEVFEAAPGVSVQQLSVLDELDDAWSVVQEWLGVFLRGELRPEEDGEAEAPMVAEELLAFPGLEELIALRAIRKLEASGEYDVCVVDCAPTGATLRLLRFPDVLRFFMENVFEWKRRSMRSVRPLARRVHAGRFIPPDEVFGAVERLYQDVADVQQILLDGDRTSARLVVNPARVVVDETRRSFAYLSLYGVATDALLVNRVLPSDAASGYFAHWAKREREELEEIDRSFPVPRFALPLQRREPIGAEALTALGRQIFGDEDPARIFSTSRPIRLRKRASTTVLEIDLPNVRSEEVEVAEAGRDLVVRIRNAERLISLPDSLAGRLLEGVHLRDGVLEVCFAP
ncbi:MAG: ArsA family ATPase [Myxococcota bacterium]|nr:ArsA family ATPase [Myxococcota bacterium]